MATATKKTAAKKPAKRKQVKTEVLCSVVLDKSGSMEVVRDATIEGFNGFLAEQRKLKSRLTLTQFDTTFDVNFVAEPAESIPDLTTVSYTPGGATALFDAVARTIRETESWLKAEDWKGKVLFVIVTDGQENSSREHNLRQVADLIKAKEAEGWEFVFMGAGIDAYQDAQRMGVPVGNALSYASTPAATSSAWAAASTTSRDFASGQTTSGRLMADYQGDESLDSPYDPPRAKAKPFESGRLKPRK